VAVSGHATTRYHQAAAVSSSNRAALLLRLGVMLHLFENLVAGPSPSATHRRLHRVTFPRRSPRLFFRSSDQNADLNVRVTSDKASAATSLSIFSKMASRWLGPSASTISARSAGCMFSSSRFECLGAGAAGGRAPECCRTPAYGVGRNATPGRRRIRRAAECPRSSRRKDAADANIDF